MTVDIHDAHHFASAWYADILATNDAAFKDTFAHHSEHTDHHDSRLTNSLSQLGVIRELSQGRPTT